MFENEKILGLSDLIDIKLLQELQDTFALSMGVASIAVDHKGIVTRPSNFTEFCTKYTRGSALGLKKCIDCDIHWGNVAAERGEPVIYKCHTGLTDFAVPIVVEGRHVGSILGGQVLTEAPDEKHFREVAKELSIDPDDYIAAVKKIKIVPMGNIEAAARLLYIVANTISEIGHKNLELFQKNKIEGLYRIIMGSINATTNVEETKKRIVNIIGQTLHVDRCFIVEYDKTLDKFSAVKEEYLSSPSIGSYKEIDLNTEFPEKSNMVKRGKAVIYDSSKNKGKELQMMANESPLVTANLGIPLHFGSEMLGALVVHYVDKEHFISQDEIKLITSTAAQISVVIHQEKLYKSLKKTIANQNAILNNMPFMAWLKDSESRLLATNEAYAKMCNTTINNLLGKTDFDLFPREHAEIYVGEDKKVIQEKQTISNVEPIVGPDGVATWHETYKSPVFDGKGNVIGTVGLSRDITDKKEAETELLRRQAEIVKASEREKINRAIIDVLRSTLDKETIKHQFVMNLGAFFKADRVCISEFDSVQGEYLPIDKNSEYLSSSKEKSFVGYLWNTPETREFIQPLLDRKEIRFDSLEKYVADNHLGQDFVRIFADMDVKSSYNLPILYQDRLMGFFCVEFTNKFYEMTDAEMVFLRGICRQAGVALYHAELYAKAQDRFSLSETAVFKIIDKIKEPLRTIIQETEVNAEKSKELGSLTEDLKALMAIIQDV